MTMSFSDDRIMDKVDACTNKLRNSDISYNRKLQQFNDLFHDLQKSLTDEQMSKVDQILSLSNLLSADEMIAFYKMYCSKSILNKWKLFSA